MSIEREGGEREGEKREREGGERGWGREREGEREGGRGREGEGGRGRETNNYNFPNPKTQTHTYSLTPLPPRFQKLPKFQLLNNITNKYLLLQIQFTCTVYGSTCPPFSKEWAHNPKLQGQHYYLLFVMNYI